MVKKRNSSKKKLWVVLITVSALLLTLAISVIIPMSMSDGLEKFEGNERKAAQQGLAETRELYSSSIEQISAIGTFQYQVTTVRSVDIPNAGVFSKCKNLYEVNVTRISFFGMMSAPDSRLVCFN